MNATATRDTDAGAKAPGRIKLYVGRRMAITEERFRERGNPPEEAARLANTAPVLLEARVFVLDGEDFDDLHHYPLHSTDGFEWGYLGSGPAELARCLLLDHLGLAARSSVRDDDTAGLCDEVYDPATDEVRELPVSYQAFKTDVVARWNAAEWHLPGIEIDEWMARYLGR